jgi:hypothetical protein
MHMYGERAGDGNLGRLLRWAIRLGQPLPAGRLTEGIAHFGQAGLGPHQGLTVVVAIPRGAVASAGPILLQER